MFSRLANNALERWGAVFSSELLLSASVLFLPVLYATAALSLLTGIGLGLWVLPAGLLLWVGALVMLHRQEGWQKLALTLLSYLTVCALVAWGTSHTLDLFWDSRDYHSVSLLAFWEGANPYHYPDDWTAAYPDPYPYPAAHWLLSISLVFWTHSFEASFVLTVIATFTAFLCTLRFLVLLGLDKIWRNLLAILLAANPIALWCFFTHHNDGLLVSVLLSAFMLMLFFVVEKKAQGRKERIRKAVWLAATLVLLVNIKFTGLVYGGILGVTALAYGVARKIERKRLVQLAGLGCVSAIVAVVLFGFFPYVTNTVKHRNPFYPASPFDAEITVQRGVLLERFVPAFEGRSSYEKWWIGLFSEQGEAWNAPVFGLPPFSSSRPISFLLGFGSLFSGALLLCLTLVFFVRHRGAWLLLAGVMASILLPGLGFSARLAPQNWWLPLLFVIFLFSPDDGKLSLSRAQKIVALVVVFCLLYVSILRLGRHGGQAVAMSLAVQRVEKQGGWFVTINTEKKDRIYYDTSLVFFNYYKSGLTGVDLPSMEECPEQAERQRPIIGLALCRP